MATGGNDQLKPGHEGYGWGTDGEMIGPSEPQSTLRLSYTGAARTAAGDEISARLGLKKRHATIVAESSWI